MSLQDTNICTGCDERISLGANYCPNCGEPNEIEWPIRFDTVVNSTYTTAEMVQVSRLPQSDEVIDALYHFPGGVTINAKLDNELDVEVLSLEYEGEVYTREEGDGE